MRSANGDRRRTLGGKRHPRAATEPKIDTACSQSLLHFGVAAETGDFHVEALFGKQPLRNADIPWKESPGDALRLADADQLIGARRSRAGKRKTDNRDQADKSYRKMLCVHVKSILAASDEVAAAPLVVLLIIIIRSRRDSYGARGKSATRQTILPRPGRPGRSPNRCRRQRRHPNWQSQYGQSACGRVRAAPRLPAIADRTAGYVRRHIRAAND